MTSAADEIMTLDEVAAFLKVGKRTVYRLAAAKRIPAFKLGGAWRFSRSDIDSWIKQQSMYGVDAREGGNNEVEDQSHNKGRE